MPGSPLIDRSDQQTFIGLRLSVIVGTITIAFQERQMEKQVKKTPFAVTG